MKCKYLDILIYKEEEREERERGREANTKVYRLKIR